MKLLRYGEKGAERPGILDSQGTIRDLGTIVEDISGSVLTRASLDRLRASDINSLPLVESTPRYGPPISGVGKFICVGLNYADHAAESGMDIPSEPVLFMKATTAVSGANDHIVIPRGSLKTDWEVELGVVIGDTTRDVAVEQALDHVAGYVVVNDLSERAFQLEQGGQWVKGKSCDTFGPIGPFLVTREDVPDVQNLTLWLDVNGNRRQTGNTGTMVFGVAFLVSYISRYMTLMPGDVISTGTPPGVGMGMEPPTYLKPGDTVTLGIEGLGAQQQQVVDQDSLST